MYVDIDDQILKPETVKNRSPPTSENLSSYSHIVKIASDKKTLAAFLSTYSTDHQLLELGGYCSAPAQHLKILLGTVLF